MVSAVVATFAVLAAWAIPNSKYCGSSGLDWGEIALGCSSASEGELEGAQGGDTADSRGAEICVLPAGPTASGGTACMCFTCMGCHVLNEMCLQKRER